MDKFDKAQLRNTFRAVLSNAGIKYTTRCVEANNHLAELTKQHRNDNLVTKEMLEAALIGMSHEHLFSDLNVVDGVADAKADPALDGKTIAETMFNTMVPESSAEDLAFIAFLVGELKDIYSEFEAK